MELVQKDELEKRKNPEKHIFISSIMHDLIHEDELRIALQWKVINDADKIRVPGFKIGAFNCAYDVYRKQSNASELVHNATFMDQILYIQEKLHFKDGDYFTDGIFRITELPENGKLDRINLEIS